jgi:hypothetical protein
MRKEDRTAHGLHAPSRGNRPAGEVDFRATAEQRANEKAAQTK